MIIKIVLDHVLIMPHTRENIEKAYKIGYLSFEMMKKKLDNFEEEHELLSEAC